MCFEQQFETSKAVPSGEMAYLSRWSFRRSICRLTNATASEATTCRVVKPRRETYDRQRRVRRFNGRRRGLRRRSRKVGERIRFRLLLRRNGGRFAGQQRCERNGRNRI